MCRMRINFNFIKNVTDYVFRKRSFSFPLKITVYNLRRDLNFVTSYNATFLPSCHSVVAESNTKGDTPLHKRRDHRRR